MPYIDLFKKISILLIEDNRCFYDFLKKKLCKIKLTVYKLYWCQTLPQGIEFINANAVDSIILDLNLPGSSGIEAIKKIHEISSVIPIIVLTQFYEKSMRLSALKHGAQDYLVKGQCNTNLFCRVINSAIEKKQTDLNLIQAWKETAKANEAKSVFLSTISHEIRTPMNGILGMNSLLMETSLTKEQTEYAENITTSGKALVSIINDILDYSKIESEKMNLTKKHFDLRSSVESAISLYSYKAVEKNIEFTLLIHENVPNGLKGDPSRLQQIIINLMSNAIKFTNHGKVSKTVSVISESNTRVEIRFEIKDTGIGIPHKDQSKLFKSFSQVDSATTRNFGGTGLGLIISKRLVELMDGTIGFKSEVNNGSVFWFTIPFEKSSDKKV